MQAESPVPTRELFWDPAATHPGFHTDAGTYPPPRGSVPKCCRTECRNGVPFSPSPPLDPARNPFGDVAVGRMGTPSSPAAPAPQRFPLHPQSQPLVITLP